MRQIADVMVLDRLLLPIDDHQPGVGPVAQRLLGHQVPRKLVIEWHGTGRHGRRWLETEEVVSHYTRFRVAAKRPPGSVPEAPILASDGPAGHPLPCVNLCTLSTGIFFKPAIECEAIFPARYAAKRYAFGQ